jgi:hypothetical protein
MRNADSRLWLKVKDDNPWQILVGGRVHLDGQIFVASQGVNTLESYPIIVGGRGLTGEFDPFHEIIELPGFAGQIVNSTYQIRRVQNAIPNPILNAAIGVTNGGQDCDRLF